MGKELGGGGLGHRWFVEEGRELCPCLPGWEVDR